MIIKDNPHPKILLYQSEEKIGYASIEVHRQYRETRLNNIIPENIKIPYCFDIMYKNANNFKKTYKKICANEKVEIDPGITVKPKYRSEDHRFKIRCKIIPAEFKSELIKLNIEIEY